MKKELVLGPQTNPIDWSYPLSNTSPFFPKAVQIPSRGGLKLWSSSSSETQPVVMSLLTQCSHYNSMSFTQAVVMSIFTQCGHYNSIIFTGRAPPEFEATPQRNPNNLGERSYEGKVIILMMSYLSNALLLRVGLCALSFICYFLAFCSVLLLCM